MKVKDIHQNDPNAELCFVQTNSKIEKIYEVLMRNKHSRVVYVLDPSGKLMGHVEIGAILSYYGARFASGPIDMLTKFSEFLAHQASDLMSSPIYVRLENEIQVAVKVMLESSIYEMPVVDDDLKVIGNVTCFELLQALKENQKKD